MVCFFSWVKPPFHHFILISFPYNSMKLLVQSPFSLYVLTIPLSSITKFPLFHGLKHHFPYGFMASTTMFSMFSWVKPSFSLQGGAPKIAKLVNITPITMVYGTQITIVFMGFINQLTSLGGPTLYTCSIFGSPPKNHPGCWLSVVKNLPLNGPKWAKILGCFIPMCLM